MNQSLNISVKYGFLAHILTTNVWNFPVFLNKQTCWIQYGKVCRKLLYIFPFKVKKFDEILIKFHT